MEFLEKYKTAISIIMALITASVAYGILYNTVWSTSSLAVELDRTATINGNRITALEENTRAIKEALGEIKQDLRGINNKLDRE